MALIHEFDWYLVGYITMVEVTHLAGEYWSLPWQYTCECRDWPVKINMDVENKVTVLMDPWL